MAFRFNWPEFDTEFYDEARSQLEAALNKGNKPKNIVDHIAVKELNMGTQPPELEILEIGELSTDKFRGIFKLTYAGDAYIVLQTKVQANPMHAKQSELPRHSRPNILAANQPLVVPMLLRISDLRLRGIVVLVVSKTKGVTLVFKNDPLENILISSTFDSVSSVRNFLQREIEKQLRNLFQEDLPVMIHNLSLRHIQSEQEKQKKQQQEERLKQQRLQSLSRERSATDASTVTADSLSLPELSPSMPRSRSATPTTASVRLSSNDSLLADETVPHHPYMGCMHVCSSCSDLYVADVHAKPPMAPASIDSFDLASESRWQSTRSTSGGAPVTAANLSTLNRLYSHRFTGGLHYHNLLYTEYATQAMMMGGWSPHHAAPSAPTPALASSHTLLHDTRSLPDLGLASEPDDSIQTQSELSPPPETFDPFADDADAPWYVTEGLERPNSPHVDVPSTLLVDQEIVLDPTENAAAAKLVQLANAHHTISSLSYTPDPFPGQGSSHVFKKMGMSSRHKKIPKRRIIRLHSIDA